MVAVVAGGTGLTGAALLRRLAADPAFSDVICVGRRPVAIANSKILNVAVRDLRELPSVGAQLRGDAYFCCLGTTIKVAGSQERFAAVDHDAVVDFAKIAEAHDAKAFVLVSAMAANASSRIFYNRVKGRTEDDVRALGLRSLAIFRPALLVGDRKEFRLAERLAEATLVPLARVLPSRWSKAVVTRVETLSAHMIDAAKRAANGERIVEARDI